MISTLKLSYKNKFLVALVFSLCVFGVTHAHQGEPESADTEGVEHAQQDTYWAEKAKDYPAFVASAARTIEVAQRPADDGAWSPVIEWPHIPVTAANLPDGRILTFASNQRSGFPVGPEFTYAATWDPSTNEFIENNHNSHDMFCGHLSMLEDGRVFINGGRNHVKTTSTFDYRTNSWQSIDQMNRGRWYPTTVALPTGSVLTAIGSSGGQYPELWTEGEGWKSLTGASLQSPILSYTQFFESNWWPLLHVDPRGKVFHSGPTPKMHSINPTGLGSVTKVGPELNDWYPKHGTTVMFDEGKLLVAGGAQSGSNAQSTNKAMIIDISNEEPVVTQIPSMNYARKFQNGVMLPNGEVLVVGGNTSGIKFNDSGTILPTEIWNPETKQWRVIDSISVPRNYHSIALLLTDGRVLSAGGGLCNCAADHSNGQVLTPPYLYNDDGSLASRPVITNAPDVIKNGLKFNLQSSNDISKFSLIKMSSTTHAVNTDLRYLKMPFTHDGNGNYQLTAHNNVNVLTPGYWMLFAVNSSGVPSVAKVIQVSTRGLPQVTPPNNQSSVVGQTVSLAIVANDPDNNPLTYQATGLPLGLSINRNSGVISGRVTNTGIYTPTITISDNESSLQLKFNWRVFPSGSTPGVSFEYYEGDWSSLPDFDQLNPVKTGTVANFVLQPRNRADKFAFRFSARIIIDQAGDYTFYTSSDDGSKLWIDNLLVVDNDRLQAVTERSGQVHLSAGEHAIVVGYFDFGGSDSLTVQYSSASISKRQIPNSKLIQNPIRNVAPAINNPGDQISSINAVVNVNITGSDANGDTLSYTATGLPSGLSINSATGLITGTTSSQGNFITTITISDGQGAADNISFNWQVIAPISINPIESAPQQNGNTISYNADVSGGGTLRYRWNFGDGTATTAYSGTRSISHRYANAGTYVVTLFVQDETDKVIEYQFVQAIHAPLTARSPRNSSSIAYQSRAGNNRLWSVNPDNNTVTVFDTVAHTKLSEISVASRPAALAFAPNGRLWVTNKDASKITIINASNFNIEQTINLKSGSQPHGIVFTPNGNDAYVALEGSGQLIRLNPATGAIKSTRYVGPRPRHLGINATSSKVFVSLFVTPKLPNEGTANPSTLVNGKHYGGEVIVVNATNNTINKKIILRHNNVQDAEHSARGIPNYLGPVVIAPDGNSAWVSSKQDNIKRGVLRDGRQLTPDSTVRSISSRINLNNELEELVSRIDHDNGGIASTSIFSKTGNYLFVALEGSREIAVIDAYRNEEFYRFTVGRAPQGLALSEDGMTLFTHNFMDRSVIAHDINKIITARATEISQVATYKLVSNEKLALNVFNGKQLFYDARDQRLAREQYISCASCHNEGDSDGRVWDMTGFGEGLRNTIALIGHGGMAHGPLHWSANFDEIQDFEGQIRNMSGGTGLMSDNNFHAGSRDLPLGDSKAGISQDLDDLASYVASLDRMPISPNKNTNGSLTSSAVQGQQLFIDKGCNSCHSGQHFTDSADNNLHNVGTLRSSSGSRLFESLSGIDTPTLKGLWMTGPYLHNGSADTIEAAISAHSNVNVSSNERSQIAAYLSQLDRTVSNPSTGISNQVNVGDISVNGEDTDWNGIPSYANDANDVSGINNPIDINHITVAHDSTHIHLLYKNHSNVDPQNTAGEYLAWGWQLFIDIDQNSATGYQAGTIGADYVIEGNQVQQYQGSGTDWNWLLVGQGPSVYNTNTAEISFDRNLIDNPDSFRFIFMGANQAYNGTAVDLYPDSLNSAQANNRFFEYNLNATVVNTLEQKPVAIPQNINVQRNSSINISLQGSDAQNDPLVYTIVSTPTNGSLSGSGQNILYSPNLNYTGSDSFNFIVNDGNENSEIATVSITIRAPQTGVISNPVLNLDIDGNANDWHGLSRFADDPDEVSDSGNIIDWQNAALAHSSEKLFLLLKNRNNIDTGSGSYLPWGWQTYFDTDNNPDTGYRIGEMGAEYILEGNQLHRYIGTGTDYTLAEPIAVDTWYNNDVIEISFNRNEISDPRTMRVGFLGNNEAYEGLSIDLYPDNLDGNISGIGYFEYSFVENVQTANRPVAASLTTTTEINTSVSITLSQVRSNDSDTSETGVDFIVITTPKHGTLTGTGANRTYKPDNNFTGDDSIQYIIQNDVHQSSIATVSLEVKQGNDSNDSGGSDNSDDSDESGGGSLPIELLWAFLLFILIKQLAIKLHHD